MQTLETGDDVRAKRSPAGCRVARRLARALLICCVRVALAQTDEIQVYDAGIAPVGIINLTWHNNYAASGARSAAFDGGIVPNHSLNGVTEWAYGVTGWFEAGLYVPLYSVSSSGAVTYNGFKLRTLFAVPNAASRQFFYGINFEFSNNTRHWDTKTFTAEIRPIIGWRAGAIEFIVNPIIDYTSQGFAGLDFAPATRLAYRICDVWSVAAEEYDDFGPMAAIRPRGEAVSSTVRGPRSPGRQDGD